MKRKTRTKANAAAGTGLPISRRAEQIPPFMVMEVLERAQALEQKGRKIYHFEVGEPDFDTPEPIKRAADRAIQSGQTHYTHSMGKLALREAIAEHYRKRYGVRVDPARVVVTSGTSPAMLLVFAALCEAGDGVILPDPHYACYPNFLRLVDARPVRVPVSEQVGFALEPDEVRRALDARTRAVLINSPSNPTGCVLSGESMRALAEVGPLVISDEIYHGLTYEGEEHSILEYTDRAVVINGFSKLYAMTGWRLGYVILPEDLVRPVQKMQQNFFISAASFAQDAAIAALCECDREVQAMRAQYAARRRVMVERVREAGLGVACEPTGAFYVFANARRFGNDSLSLAFEILENAGVAVTPGMDFGPGGEGFLRFSYATALEDIEQGTARLAEYLASREG